jgi:hypothetical protein
VKTAKSLPGISGPAKQDFKTLHTLRRHNIRVDLIQQPHRRSHDTTHPFVKTLKSNKKTAQQTIPQKKMFFGFTRKDILKPPPPTGSRIMTMIHQNDLPVSNP